MTVPIVNQVLDRLYPDPLERSRIRVHLLQHTGHIRVQYPNSPYSSFIPPGATEAEIEAQLEADRQLQRAAAQPGGVQGASAGAATGKIAAHGRRPQARDVSISSLVALVAQRFVIAIKEHPIEALALLVTIIFGLLPFMVTQWERYIENIALRTVLEASKDHENRITRLEVADETVKLKATINRLETKVLNLEAQQSQTVQIIPYQGSLNSFSVARYYVPTRIPIQAGTHE